jgi:hypothetical protein
VAQILGSGFQKEPASSRGEQEAEE